MAKQTELTRRQRALADFGDFVLDHDELDAILDEGCRLVAQALDTQLAKVVEIEGDTQTGLVRAGVGWTPGIVRQQHVSLQGRSSEAYAIEKTMPIITKDIAQETRFEFPSFLRDHGVVALVNVPILLPGRRPWGVLQVDATRPREFDEEDIEFLKTYAMVLGPVIDRLAVASDRNRIEQVLNESTERLRLAIEVGELASWDWNVRTGEVVWNDRHFLMQGYGVAEVTPSFDAWVVRVHPEDRAEALTQIEKARDDHKAYTHIFRTLLPDGDVRWCSARGRFFYDDHGVPSRMVGVMEDITERKHLAQQQEYLLKLNDALSPLTNAADIKAAAVNLLGEHLRADRVVYAEHHGEYFEVGENYASQVAADLIGGSPFSAFGKSVSTLQAGQLVVVDDVNSGVFDEEERASFLAMGVRAVVAIPLVKASRLLVNLSIHQQSPRKWGLDEIALARETAERAWAGVQRARAEEALRDREADLARVQRIGEVGGLDIDVARGLRSVRSPEYLRLHGLPRDGRDESHADWLARVHPEDREHAERALFAALESDALVYDSEYRIVRPSDGAVRWMHARADIERDGSGRAVRLVGAHTDVTEQKRSTEALRESEERLESELRQTTILANLAERLVTEERLPEIYEEILSAAISITGSDAGTVRIYDPESKSLVLLVARGMPGNMTDHFRRVDASSSTACGIALRTGERSFVDFDADLEDTACRMHVEAGYQSAQETPMLSRSGGPIGMLSTHWRKSKHRPTQSQLKFLDLLARQAADLIDQRRSEDSLRASEERLRQFGEASQDVLWIRDAERLQWQYLTPAFEAIYGLSREETLSGDNFRSWIELVVPEDRAIAAGAMDRVREGEYVTFDYRIRRPRDGAIRWLRNTDFPIRGADGKIALIGGIGHDLTELRDAEQRLTTLMEGIPQLVWRAADRGKWAWSSPQWSDFTGLSFEESLDFGWLAALHPDERGHARQIWEVATRSGQLEMEGRICHAASREYRWFRTRATPVRNDAGDIVEWLGTSTDVHDLRELQERQQVLVAELQHRTRNLMGVVRSTSRRTAEASTDILDFQRRFNDRLEALARVQGLLSRLNETDRISFDELVRSELLAMDGAANNVTLKGPTGIRLRSSMVQTLAMALHELATNAVKYGALSQPGAHLSVEWSVASPDRRGRPRLHIDWRESGVTMPDTTSGPRAGGQGRELIEEALPYQLDAETSLEFGPDGIHCTITIPVSQSNETAGDDG
ncbi:PAS domain-containing protein [Sphingobium yanoikuyae]|uniref:histidine kinase n=1 Tax=Sphingobium yanoikuyae TaxID=13690 RepID=A0A291MXL7_SPHYA|nr:PAS domain-containing protein [Sphingobium yanoikuyae]ATI79859.1 hypothetical protein A6768_07360 [Sphingobium yanoikuyae]